MKTKISINAQKNIRPAVLFTELDEGTFFYWANENLCNLGVKIDTHKYFRLDTELRTSLLGEKRLCIAIPEINITANFPSEE